MKKLLIQLDTDEKPSTFDVVVAYDGGADHVVSYGGVTPDNVQGMVEGAIFTRKPDEKKNTALFIGGSSMDKGHALLEAVKQCFFADFRVSVMLDSNGSNTTAAAAVIRTEQSTEVKGRRAVILAGTGPVGQRAAAMLAQSGADVTITSRSLENAQRIVQGLADRFSVQVKGIAAATPEARGEAVQQADIVLATGSSGVELLEEKYWRDNKTIKALTDANATPPLGITGIKMYDKGVEYCGKIAWGAIGFGALKLKLHRACIDRLFTSNHEIMDAEDIYKLGREMA